MVLSLLLVSLLLQIGNAVAPPMASALGRCLLQAAAKKAPVAEPVIYVSCVRDVSPAVSSLSVSIAG